MTAANRVPTSNPLVRPLATLTVAICAVAVLGAQGQPSFRARVDLVALPVTVTEPATGRYVTDLQLDDFVVLEDGRPQEITFFSKGATPLAVTLLIDTSGSMRRDLPLAKDAASAFVSRLQPDDVAQIMEFDGRVRTLQEFTNDRRLLDRAIGDLRLGGSTSLYTAVYVALDLFDTLPPPASDTVRRDVIVLLSDGADTSSLVEFDQLIEQARRSPAVIYAVGLGLTAPRGRTNVIHPQFALRRLSQDTGGRLIEARTGRDLTNVYTDIADELNNQYVIGYVSSNRSTAGGWRTVSVRVARQGMHARTRAGYYAPRIVNPLEGLL